MTNPSVLSLSRPRTSTSGAVELRGDCPRLTVDVLDAVSNARRISRFEYRTGLFQRRGFPFVQAAELAHELWERDADKDDRRMCIECKHFQQSRTCARRGLFLRQTLQRCPLFAWQTPA